MSFARCRNLIFHSLVLINLAAVMHACLPSGVRSGCDCQTQPSCGPCQSAPATSYGNHYDSAPSSYAQAGYQAPGLGVAPTYPLPPPPPPSPQSAAFPVLLPPPPVPGNDVSEYQPPPINLPPSPANTSPEDSSYQEAQGQGHGQGDGQGNDVREQTVSPSEGSSQYPSQEYQQMLPQGLFPSPPEDPQIPQPVVQTSTASYSESHMEAVVSADANNNNDQTAYRGAYSEDTSHAHFETGSSIVGPIEDSDIEIEPMGASLTSRGPQINSYSGDSDRYQQPEHGRQTTPAASTTPPPTRGQSQPKYPEAPEQEYLAVVKEVAEERQPVDPFFTYSNQVCTGVVLMKHSVASVAAAAHKCSEIGCAAANIRAATHLIRGKVNQNRKFDVIYLKSADARRDNAGFHCIAVSRIPMFSNDFDRIEAEIDLNRPENESRIDRINSRGTHTHAPPFGPPTVVSGGRAPGSPLRIAETTTFKPRIFRFATIEPKSAY